MWQRKSSLMLLLFLAAAALSMTAQNAHAETEIGKNYDKTFLGSTENGDLYKWESRPERLVDHYDIIGNPVYANYKLFENSTIIQLETAGSGSIIFDKPTCTYDVYKSGFIAQNRTAQIRDVSWTVKGKLSSASTWNDVNSINNAACVVSTISDPDSVTITGTKTNGLGTFQIVLEHVHGHGIKETMRAYNNNPAWNNHNIGFAESFKVPRIIHLGNQTFDLAAYNNVVLGRNWIGNNTEKLINLSDDLLYDFGLGWENLNDIKISWDGSSASLTLNYLYPSGIVPYQQWVEVDPTFTGTPSSEGRVIGDVGGVSVNCATTRNSGDANLIINKDNSGNVNGICTAPYFNFDVSSIPNTAIVSASGIEYDVTGATTPTNCDWKWLSATGANNEATYDALTQDVGATDIKQNDSTCTTVANGKIVTFDTGGYATLIQSDITGDNIVSIGSFFTNLSRDGTDRQVIIRAGDMILSITYLSTKADAITTLVATPISTTEIDLDWSAPNLNGGTLQGYMINYTTPCGIPTTTLVNNTGTSAVSYSVSGLTIDTCYSFRVGAWTQLGVNGSGNIANATTLPFNAGNFTVGSLSFNAVNQDVIPIFFERTDINTTALYLNVTYPNTWNIACDFTYKFAQINQTYTGFAATAISATSDESRFQFINVDREIIAVFCWDQNGTGEGRYLITQDSFPLLVYLDRFTSGHYGTSGDFGSIDLIYLAVVIVSLVGLNRTNESVGAGFMIVITAAMAWFEIITIPTAAISGIGLAVMLIIITTRKE